MPATLCSVSYSLGLVYPAGMLWELAFVRPEETTTGAPQWGQVVAFSDMRALHSGQSKSANLILPIEP